jgi:hypothetical protein
LIAFSVQLAAELMSAAAPRTVLHAASTKPLPMSIAVIAVRTMVISLFANRNDHGMDRKALPAEPAIAALG